MTWPVILEHRQGGKYRARLKLLDIKESVTDGAVSSALELPRTASRKSTIALVKIQKKIILFQGHSRPRPAHVYLHNYIDSLILCSNSTSDNVLSSSVATSIKFKFKFFFFMRIHCIFFLCWSRKVGVRLERLRERERERDRDRDRIKMESRRESRAR